MESQENYVERIRTAALESAVYHLKHRGAGWITPSDAPRVIAFAKEFEKYIKTGS